MKIDLLGIFAHPDDAELCAAGTLLVAKKQGKKIGVIDLTEGELGTRGSVELRYKEAAASSEIIGLSVRENLKLPDGFFENNQENLLKVITAIRKYQPEIVIANALSDRHPDHGNAAALVDRASFLSGLKKIETHTENGGLQEPWRPKQIYFAVQSDYLDPDIIVDISSEMDQKLEAIMAFKTQFFDPDSKEPKTFISSKGFLDLIKGRATEYGMAIRKQYGEGFNVKRKLGTKSLFDLIN